MILVNGSNHLCDVNHGQAEETSAIDDPVIPTGASNGKWWQRPQRAPGKDEVVNRPRRAKRTMPGHKIAQSFLPVVVLKIPGLSQGHTPVPPRHQERVESNLPDGRQEIIQQHNIGIDVADQIIPSQLLGVLEDKVQEWGAIFIRGHIGDMPYVELGSHLGYSLVVSKEDDFALWTECQPTPNGISLDNCTVTSKRFGDGE
jgi:hypothetical protein